MGILGNDIKGPWKPLKRVGSPLVLEAVHERIEEVLEILISPRFFNCLSLFLNCFS